MDIKDILDTLGLDLSNPESKRGALDAINAILSSRSSGGFEGGTGGGNMGGELEVELDPDLLLPSQKQQPSAAGGDDDLDIEIEDEENVLGQIKRNESEDDVDTESSSTEKSSDDSDSGSADSEQSDSDGDSDSSDNKDSSNSNSEENDQANNSEQGDEAEADSEEGSKENSSKAGEEEEPIENDNEGSSEDTDESSDESSSEDSEDISEYDDSEYDDSEELEDVFDDEEPEDDSEDDSDDEVEPEDDFDYDEDDLLDDTLKDPYEDENIKTKADARRIKRDRTLHAARTALEKAKAKNAPSALVRELEKSIEALEALTEAVTKSIKDISDEEFNLLVNRVFDAIEALGDSDLTFTSAEERELQAKEIKANISSTKTQQDLSAEDIAHIRAEAQAVKAREKESDKYKARPRGSFKGFQDFLNSLYRAVALQVHVEETNDDSWSALNRRYGGSGVLQPGKRLNELPNKKIPVIDFYFDCSGSWTGRDLAVGQKAVNKLVEMEENGDIKINIFYFANNVFNDVASARAQGGTRAWNDIVKNIIATQATNVIIMTDSDMDDWWDGPKALSYTVPGYVWYLWRDGDNAPRLPRDLKGRGGTQQFSFSTADA